MIHVFINIVDKRLDHVPLEQCCELKRFCNMRDGEVVNPHFPSPALSSVKMMDLG